MHVLLGTLNPAAGQPDWQGRADVHYMLLWDSNSLPPVDYEVVGCGISELPVETCKSQAGGGDFPLHVYHNHSPTTNLTPHRRKLLLRALWAHVTAKTSVAQPAVVFGVDFNCTDVQWIACIEHIMTPQDSRRTLLQ